MIAERKAQQPLFGGESRAGRAHSEKEERKKKRAKGRWGSSEISLSLDL